MNMNFPTITIWDLSLNKELSETILETHLDFGLCNKNKCSTDTYLN